MADEQIVDTHDDAPSMDDTTQPPPGGFLTPTLNARGRALPLPA